jgi:hypothetical protein
MGILKNHLKVEMKIVGMGIDHSNICTNYNTMYLDRDNNDPATVGCMTKVLKFYEVFFTELIEAFSYTLYRINHDEAVALKEMVKKRFLFYSLEKEITMQTFLLHKTSNVYESIEAWSKDTAVSLLIKNDEEGEGIYLYCEKNTALHQWILQRLDGYNLDEVELSL